jgi:hypothetical protein
MVFSRRASVSGVAAIARNHAGVKMNTSDRA